MLTDWSISTVEVAEAMHEVFGSNGRQKALQALDALFRKQLVEKIKRSDRKRGTVADLMRVDWLLEGWITDKQGNRKLSGLAPGDLCRELREQLGTRLR